MMISLRRSGAGLSLLLMTGIITTKIHADEMPVACEDFGPDAVTNALGVETPQTCIDVPFDDGTSSVMVSRCFYTYVPPGCVDRDDDSPVPMVVDMHGYSSCPKDLAPISGWKELADEHCFVVVYPSGQVDRPGTQGPCFSLPGGLEDSNYTDITTAACCCMDLFNPTPDNSKDSVSDPLFIRMAIDKAVEDNSDSSMAIDRSRVYMAGHSNGCIAALSMAALYPDDVAAVACHAGAVITPFDIDSASDRVPVWMVHGTADDDVPFEGSPNWPLPFPTWEYGIWGMAESLDYLANNNGCLGETEIVGEETILYRRDECTNGATVELLALPGVGHYPYKTAPELKPFFEMMMGPVPDVDTTKMAWEFCSAHSKAVAPGPLAESGSEDSGGGSDDATATTTAEEEEEDGSEDSGGGSDDATATAENGSQDSGGSDEAAVEDESAAARPLSKAFAVVHGLWVVSSFVSNCF